MRNYPFLERFAQAVVGMSNLVVGVTMPAVQYATTFRSPLGNGLSTPILDSDPFYAAFGIDEPNDNTGRSHHLGADRIGNGGGDTHLRNLACASGNASVPAFVSKQGATTSVLGGGLPRRLDRVSSRPTTGDIDLRADDRLCSQPIGTSCYYDGTIGFLIDRDSPSD